MICLCYAPLCPFSILSPYASEAIADELLSLSTLPCENSRETSRSRSRRGGNSNLIRGISTRIPAKYVRQERTSIIDTQALVPLELDTPSRRAKDCAIVVCLCVNDARVAVIELDGMVRVIRVDFAAAAMVLVGPGETGPLLAVAAPTRVHLGAAPRLGVGVELGQVVNGVDLVLQRSG